MVKSFICTQIHGKPILLLGPVLKCGLILGPHEPCHLTMSILCCPTLCCPGGPKAKTPTLQLGSGSRSTSLKSSILSRSCLHIKLCSMAISRGMLVCMSRLYSGGQMIILKHCFKMPKIYSMTLWADTWCNLKSSSGLAGLNYC